MQLCTLPADGTPLAGSPVFAKEVPADDIDAAFAIESASYPADEAATHEGLAFRQKAAGSFFQGAYAKDQLVGFIVSTLSPGDTLEEETMSSHDPSGRTLCIHSVVVDPSHRRKGIAISMLKRYVKSIAETGPGDGDAGAVDRILLIAKGNLLHFYVACGFSLVGLSPVVHGADPWFEMKIDMRNFRKALL